MNYDKIGNFILNLRKEKGYSQNDLARIIPISRQAISKWERGITIPDSSTLVRLSEIFDVNINELLKGERIKNNTIEELQKTTLDIVDDSVLRTHKMKIRIQILIITILVLLTSFLSYYFINSYNKIKIYSICADGDIFHVKKGLFITTPSRKYIKFDSFIYDSNSINVNKVKLYYKIDKEEYLIFEDNSLDDIILDSYGYDDLFKMINLNYFLNNSYLEIDYNDNQKETISVKFKRSFVNNNLLFLINKNVINKDNEKLKLNKLNTKFIKKIISKNKLRDDSYYDIFVINDIEYDFSYYPYSDQIIISNDDNLIISYECYTNMCYSSLKTETNNCSDDYFSLITRYIDGN